MGGGSSPGPPGLWDPAAAPLPGSGDTHTEGPCCPPPGPGAQGQEPSCCCSLLMPSGMSSTTLGNKSQARLAPGCLESLPGCLRGPWAGAALLKGDPTPCTQHGKRSRSPFCCFSSGCRAAAPPAQPGLAAFGKGSNLPLCTGDVLINWHHYVSAG